MSIIIIYSSHRNIKFGIKRKISNDVSDYLNKHQLIEKYFNNMTNFNTNSIALKESFNVYKPTKNRKNSHDSDVNFSSPGNQDFYLNNGFMLTNNLPFERDYTLDDIISSNNLSTNIFSKSIKNEFEKFQ